jgi:hypothetical protein
MDGSRAIFPLVRADCCADFISPTRTSVPLSYIYYTAALAGQSRFERHSSAVALTR